MIGCFLTGGLFAIHKNSSLLHFYFILDTDCSDKGCFYRKSG